MSGVWFHVPGLGPIRITTVLAAVAILAIVGVLRRRPWLAVVAVMGWVSAYELIFNAVGIYVFGWPHGSFLWYAAAISAWVVLAYREGIRPSRFWLLIFATTWIPWLLEGFHSNIPVGRSWDSWGELWNEVGKTALALAYLVGVLRLGEQKHLVEELIDGDRRTVIGRGLHLDGIGARLNRAFGSR